MLIASTVWLDANGNTRITLVRTSTGIGPILAGVQAISNASPVECWEGPRTTYTPVPVAAQYISGATAARLSFICADGTEAVVQVFAPALNIFMSDQTTVDPANVAVAGLIASCIGTLESASGALATGYISGSIGPRPQSTG